MKKIKTFIKYMMRNFFSMLVKQTVATCGDGLKVNYYSKVNKKTVLKNNVNMNGLIVSGQGRVVIGNNFHCGKQCLLITQSHNYEGSKIPYDDTYELKDINIEDNVWIGHRVTIIGACNIGEGSIIQAGSVVVKDVKPLSIVGGSPAIAFSLRDEKHYYTLKEKKAFH